MSMLEEYLHRVKKEFQSRKWEVSSNKKVPGGVRLVVTEIERGVRRARTTYYISSADPKLKVIEREGLEGFDAKMQAERKPDSLGAALKMYGEPPVALHEVWAHGELPKKAAYNPAAYEFFARLFVSVGYTDLDRQTVAQFYPGVDLSDRSELKWVHDIRSSPNLWLYLLSEEGLFNRRKDWSGQDEDVYRFRRAGVVWLEKQLEMFAKAKPQV